MKFLLSNSLKRLMPLLLIAVSMVLIQNSFNNKTSANGKVGQGEPEGLITLSGNVHPFAQSEKIVGKPEADFQLKEVNLVLNIRHREELEQLLADQQDIGSPNYHKWLTPEE